eukprot:8215587-Pyramimonas_sp.AAC.1
MRGRREIPGCRAGQRGESFRHPARPNRLITTRVMQPDRCSTNRAANICSRSSSRRASRANPSFGSEHVAHVSK